MNKPPSSRERQAGETRAALIDAARIRFGRDGYQHTPLDAVAADLAMTKGAAYHHFRDKTDLFNAFFLAVQRDLVRVVSEAATDPDPGRRLRTACLAYLENCTPEVIQIVLLDGPIVLRPILLGHCRAMRSWRRRSPSCANRWRRATA